MDTIIPTVDWNKCDHVSELVIVSLHLIHLLPHILMLHTHTSHVGTILHPFFLASVWQATSQLP